MNKAMMLAMMGGGGSIPRTGLLQWLFKESEPAFSGNEVIDYSGNNNNATLEASNCGAAKVGTIMTFYSALEGNLGDWVLTKQGTATPVLALNQITFSGGGTIYDLRLTNNVLGISHYYPICEKWLKVYDCSGNGNHITVTGSNIVEWSASTQNTFHYNLLHGGNTRSGELLSNPSFEGTYTAGLASGWANFSSTTRTEETTIIHAGTKAQRFTANVGSGIYASVRFRAGSMYYFSVWVYVVSGTAKLECFNMFKGSPSKETITSTKTGEWEKLEIYGIAIANQTEYPHVYAGTDSSDIIIDDCEFYCISPEIEVPSLETGINDALGRALTVSPALAKNYCETKIKLTANTDLVNADIDNFFFTAGVANSVKLRSLNFALTNLVDINRIFYDKDAATDLLVYKDALGNTSILKRLLNYLKLPLYKAFHNYKEFNEIPYERIFPVSINRNFRIGVYRGSILKYSSDYGKTWAGTYNYTALNVASFYVTSKGSILAFTTNNKIFRSADQGATFVEIVVSGVTIHTPANASYPGVYFKPFAQLCDVYDSDTNSNIIVFGNYGNTTSGANSTQLYYSTDDGVTIKTFYKFGQNPSFTDNGTSTGGVGGTLLGDSNNTHIVRHVHNVKYNSFNNKFYVCTGDTASEVNFIEFTFNLGNDTWSEANYIVSAGNQRMRMTDFDFDSDSVYWASDGLTGFTLNSIFYKASGVFKSKLTELSDVTKHITLRDLNNVVFSFLKDGNILIYTPDQSTIIGLSRDNGSTWVDLDVTDKTVFYTGAFSYPQRIVKDDKGNYFMSTTADQKYTGFYLNVVK